MQDVMMTLALRLHGRSQAAAGEMGKLSKRQEGYARHRKRLREFEEKVRDAMRDDVLDSGELESLRTEGEALGVDLSALEDLQAKGGDILLEPTAPGDEDRSEAAANSRLAKELLGAIDDKKEEIGDQDDQLGFQLQVLFNKYSTALGQASSTIQNIRQINQTLNQKLA